MDPTMPFYLYFSLFPTDVPSFPLLQTLVTICTGSLFFSMAAFLSFGCFVEANIILHLAQIAIFPGNFSFHHSHLPVMSLPLQGHLYSRSHALDSASKHDPHISLDSEFFVLYDYLPSALYIINI